MGEALARLRGQVVIATKFGWAPAPGDRERWSALNSRPEHIKEAVEGSLKPESRTLVVLLNRFAKEKKATPGQIALAWLLAKKSWIVPIPGTTKLHRLGENIGAAEIELTTDELREIERAASNISVQGARYPEHIEQMMYR